jgi:hypothetical protein
MENIKKAGGYFYKIANILILATIINIIFFIVINQAPSPEAIAADFPTRVSTDSREDANYNLQRQQAIAEKINEKIKERSYTINALIGINLFLTILIIFHLYFAANCLIEYDKIGKVEEPNIQKE